MNEAWIWEYILLGEGVGGVGGVGQESGKKWLDNK